MLVRVRIIEGTYGSGTMKPWVETYGLKDLEMV
jgi:hypothetical protein